MPTWAFIGSLQAAVRMHAFCDSLGSDIHQVFLCIDSFHFYLSHGGVGGLWVTVSCLDCAGVGPIYLQISSGSKPQADEPVLPGRC